MAQLQYKTFSFQTKRKELQVTLLKLFFMQIPLEELEKIGKFEIVDGCTLEFEKVEEEKAARKFSFLLEKYLGHLTNTLNKNKAFYIHKNSGIPLIGNVAFGILYRNTSLIEIKPITSCNLNCLYCSVKEGKNSEKNDFVVEKDYLLEELQKLLDFVEEPVEIHIGVQGEPFLYADLILLIEDLQKNQQVQTISIDTNFTLVTKSLIDQLSQFDKLQLNVSLDALDPLLAQKLVGASYDLKKILENIHYAVKKGIVLLFAPVFVPGYNEKELEKIVGLAKELNKISKKPLCVGIQNFLNYRRGRNPVKAWPWEKFYQMIGELEKKTKYLLRLSPEDFSIHLTKELPKPFKVGEVVSAVIKCPDRFPNSVIAVAKNRTISVPDCEFRKEKKIQVKILRDKHNIFRGELV